MKDVSLELGEGTLTMLIGPNGSGKTTLLNIISGVIEPDSGRIVFKGRDITRLYPHERYRYGIARSFQVPQLFTSLSVLENVLVSSRLYLEEDALGILFTNSWALKDWDQAQKAFEILSLLKLDHLWDAPARALSGGQMKLLELARALMSDPKLMLLDEPLAGVNPALAHEIMQALRRARDELGVSFLIVEHRLDLASKYVDFVYAMNQGTVISSGTPDEVFEDPMVVESLLGG